MPIFNITQRFALFLEAAELGVWDWDLPTGRGTVSPQNQRIFGLPESITEATIAEYTRLIHSDDSDRVTREFQAASRGEHNYDIEYRIRRPDGASRWVHSFGCVLPNQQRFMGFSRDITARKESQDARRASEPSYRLLFEKNPDGFFLVDPNGGFILVNPACERLSGYSEKELLKKSFFELCAPDQLAKTAAEFQRALQDPGYRELETALIRKDRTRVELLISGEAIQQDGAVVAVQCAAKDITHRKRAVEALRESEERLRQAADLVGLSPYTWDPTTGAIEWDDRLRLIWGLPADVPVRYDDWLAGLHPEDRPLVEKKVARSLDPRGDGNYEAEYRVNGADGVQRWVSVRGRTRFEEGKPVSHFGVAAEITERKRSEELLRANTARLAALVEAQRQIAAASLEYSGLLQFILERVSRLVQADGASLEIAEGDSLVYEAATGLAAPWAGLRLNRAQSLSGLCMKTGQLLRTDDTETDPRVDREACRRIGIRSMIVIPLRYDQHSFGVLKVLSARVSAFDDGAEHTVRLMGEFVGVTIARQRAQEALRDREHRLQRAQEIAHLGSWELDLVANRLTWSDEVYRIFGLQPQAFPGTYQAFLEAVHPEDRAAVDAAYLNSLRENLNAYEIEHRIVRPATGETRFIHERCQHFRDATGRIIRSIGMVHDITERKAFQAELERLVAERTGKLQEMVAELEHFSYSLTHDLRAPLRAMQGFAQLLANAYAGSSHDDTQQLLDKIRAAAERMDALILDALNYNRVIRQELPLEPVDVGALLRGMVDSYPELQSSSARIELQDGIPFVLGNKGGLTQCFSNLLNNAVKFAKPGRPAQIRIWAECRKPSTSGLPPSSQLPARPPNVIVKPSVNCVRIWIEDDGIGIPDSLRSRVFDMFSRSHTTGQGTGIGLALVRKVMDRMGGKTGVESEEGKGSRFWLELPPAIQAATSPIA